MLVVGLVFALTPIISAQRLGFSAEEFTARRQALAKAIGSGTVLLAGRTLPLSGIRFRQDNDFFYLTGNEDTNAVLAIDAPSGDSWLFLPPQSASEVRSDGKNWLTQGDQAKPRGFTAIAPITDLGEFLARRRAGGAGRPLYTRLSERDEVDDSRGEQGVGLARRLSNPLGARPSDDAWRVEVLRQHFPATELKDVTPAIDQLRVIKSPREIEILTLNGRLSAEAIRKAIEITRPGRFEYELEAEATYHLFKNGVQGNGYPAIVGTGPNVNVWHYQDNGRQMKAGDLVVMDYGGSLDYQVIDITRTWPVSGRFDELQLRAYQCALEAQKAIIAAMRPGATRAETREISKRIYEKWGFADQRPAQAGHFVGMSVHDVGDYAAPFRAGDGDRGRAHHRDRRQAAAHPHRGHGAHHRRRAAHSQRGGAEGSRRGAGVDEAGRTKYAVARTFRSALLLQRLPLPKQRGQRHQRRRVGSQGTAAEAEQGRAGGRQRLHFNRRPTALGSDQHRCRVGPGRQRPPCRRPATARPARSGGAAGAPTPRPAPAARRSPARRPVRTASPS